MVCIKSILDHYLDRQMEYKSFNDIEYLKDISNLAGVSKKELVVDMRKIDSECEKVCKGNMYFFNGYVLYDFNVVYSSEYKNTPVSNIQYSLYILPIIGFEISTTAFNRDIMINKDKLSTVTLGRYSNAIICYDNITKQVVSMKDTFIDFMNLYQVIINTFGKDIKAHWAVEILNEIH